jgi:hypothetical protein
MASQGPQPQPADSGIDLTTLFLSAIASAAAAYITSKLWGPGTLFSAAFAPVIVALVKEGLRRPTEKVANVVPAVVTPTRWSRGAADDPGLVAAPDPDAPPDTAVHRDPDAPHVVLPPVVVTTDATGPVRVYSTRARRLRWRLALITGLLGFGVCVLVFTVPELIAGQSVGGSHKTTIFGGKSHHTKKSGTTTTSTTATTPTTRTTTVTKTVTTPTTTTATPTTTTQTPSTTQAPSTAAPPTAEQPATTTP